MTTCEYVAANELAGRYAAGRLDEESAAEFEEHYLTCAHCQDELRLAAEVRRASAAAAPQTRRRTWRAWAGAGALAAAVLAALLLWPDTRRADLERLGVVTVPPVYLGVQVRAGDADAAFRELEIAVADEGVIGEQAAALADSVRTAGRR